MKLQVDGGKNLARKFLENEVGSPLKQSTCHQQSSLWIDCVRMENFGYRAMQEKYI